MDKLEFARKKMAVSEERFKSFWSDVKSRFNPIGERTLKVLDIHDHSDQCFDLIVANTNSDSLTNVENWRVTIETGFLKKPKLILSITEGPRLDEFIK